MEAESPVNTTADRATASSVTSDLEVPDARRCCDDELAHAHDERIDPEKHKELVDNYVARVLIPFHLCNELVAFARCWLTDRENENGADQPACEPDGTDEVGA